jgi:hypothetical protein
LRTPRPAGRSWHLGWGRGGVGRQLSEQSAVSLAGGEDRGFGGWGGSSANQRAESAGHADQHDGKADKNGEGRRDKPVRSKDKPGSDKDKPGKGK